MLFAARAVPFEIVVANRYRVTPTVTLALSPLLTRFAPLGVALAALLAALAAWQAQTRQADATKRGAQASDAAEAWEPSVASPPIEGQPTQAQG
ncbi:MAG TPA: hypothetical protein VF695_07480 [Sphingomonas sp.]